MRTTLTLDEDVAAGLKAEARRLGRPLPELVKETLRRGLETRCAAHPRQAFRVVARDLGDLRPGLSLDNTAQLIDRTESPVHR